MHRYEAYPESKTFLTPCYNVDFSYPAHLHNCMEVSFCVSGCVTVAVEGITHDLTPGQGILVPPNVVHSYHSPDYSAYYTILFSRDLLPELSGIFSWKKPARYTFSVDEGFLSHILAFYKSDATLFGGKALLYRMAEAFLKDNKFTETERTDPELTIAILNYIQENLSREITLQDMADHLGYSYFYMSKQIVQTLHVPFTTLLSQYRVANAKALLSTGGYSVSQVAMISGFGSIRSFNRIFRRLTGQTPSQYLAQPDYSEHRPNPAEI